MNPLAFLLAATEEAGSQAPFYITGIGLAVFAVVVSAAGIARPGFPSREGAARGLMAVSVVFVAVVMVAAALTAA